jgi:hypothetical protein
MEMKIPIIDNVVMTSDAHNIILNKEVVYEKGKNIGKKYLVATGFYPDVVTALESLLNEKMGESKARTLKGLCKEHHELVRVFREMLGVKLREVKV